MNIDQIKSEARLDLIKNICAKKKAPQVASFATAMHKIAEVKDGTNEQENILDSLIDEVAFNMQEEESLDSSFSQAFG